MQIESDGGDFLTVAIIINAKIVLLCCFNFYVKFLSLDLKVACLSLLWILKF